MTQDILITPGSGEPQILFRGSGTNDTAVELNVLSSYQSATGSGTALIFEGTEGQLFGITDNLSSGTIFSVSDITGLPLIEADASGDVKIGEYGNDTFLYTNLIVENANIIEKNNPVFTYTSGNLTNITYGNADYNNLYYDASGVLTSSSGVYNGTAINKAYYYYGDGSLSGIVYS